MTDTEPRPPPPAPGSDPEVRIAGLEHRIEVQLEELAQRREQLAKSQRDRQRLDTALAETSAALRRMRKENRKLRRDLEQRPGARDLA